MSAWMELVDSNGSDEWLELCSRALEEVQRETSRKNAEKIRAMKERLIGHSEWLDGINDAADEIDPEVSNSGP